jgi:hypothetical protein
MTVRTDRLVLVCPTCHTTFERLACAIRNQKQDPCCSKTCSAKQRGEANFKHLRNRLFSRTSQEGTCLVWTGWTDKNGYGFMSVRGREERVHRIAWFLGTGEWPPKDKEVLHRCDNPPCVLLEDLFWETKQTTWRTWPLKVEADIHAVSNTQTPS